MWRTQDGKPEGSRLPQQLQPDDRRRIRRPRRTVRGVRSCQKEAHGWQSPRPFPIRTGCQGSQVHRERSLSAGLSLQAGGLPRESGNSSYVQRRVAWEVPQTQSFLRNWLSQLLLGSADLSPSHRGTRGGRGTWSWGSSSTVQTRVMEGSHFPSSSRPTSSNSEASQVLRPRPTARNPRHAGAARWRGVRDRNAIRSQELSQIVTKPF